MLPVGNAVLSEAILVGANQVLDTAPIVLLYCFILFLNTLFNSRATGPSRGSWQAQLLSLLACQRGW